MKLTGEYYRKSNRRLIPAGKEKSARAKIAVVVSTDSSVFDMNAEHVGRIFLRKQSTLPDGSQAKARGLPAQAVRRVLTPP